MIQESNRVEFKGVLNDKMEKEVVAFLNNQAGGISLQEMVVPVIEYKYLRNDSKTYQRNRD